MSFALIFLSLITIDPRYHTLDEIARELDSIAQHYPEITHLDTIAYSTTDSLPVFAMKISDNANIEEDEPAVLFVACHHAEEILGVEICMYMINDLVHNYGVDSLITHWINNREIWIIPLLNPEGHSIVMKGIDTTWRKNKHDNNNNGQFDPDFDGVDLNRNYDFYWSEGGSSSPPSEYYRGPSPFSENESRALAELARNQHFVFCNSYHSARTGLGEVIYFPWHGACGYPPDFTFLREIADSMAKRIVNDAGNGTYNALPGWSVDGKARNFLYGVYGTFAYTVEVSTTCIQPGWMVDDICERNLAGAYYLLERVEGSGISGHIYDQKTDEPLSAEVIISGYYDPELPARRSDEEFGRFIRLLTAGTYNLEIKKNGYETVYLDGIEVEQDRLTELNIHLRRITDESSIRKKKGIEVIPNPTYGYILIQLKDTNINQLKIYDSAGRLTKIFKNPETRIVWQCDDCSKRIVPNGIYWVIGYEDDKRTVIKTIVLHN
ncbi:hypothetical protein BXT86_04955 [candidate division WOR-3 bacterium 4484_100]|uniref:carboxypeptidase T n=1 Tax=candidate division WOR-3 bacterium 4484_100 TaxID=1936077 RepID=A0A1V4QFH9_UNCW3|nr:MAG: hypothetical protein BXT86_04955 [candidate division WOR-3 bacterium 4484_100]